MRLHLSRLSMHDEGSTHQKRPYNVFAVYLHTNILQKIKVLVRYMTTRTRFLQILPRFANREKK